MFKYIDGKPDFKDTYNVDLYVIYRTNHAHHVAHVVYIYIYSELTMLTMLHMLYTYIFIVMPNKSATTLNHGNKTSISIYY